MVEKLSYPEVIRKSGIHPSYLKRLQDNPFSYVFNMGDPDDAEDKKWLDEQAPGWKLKIDLLGSQEIEIPEGIGRDRTMTSVRYNAIILFSEPEHRTAWRNRIKLQQQLAEEKRQRYEAKKAESPAGAILCTDCATFMLPETVHEVARIAQFGFRYEQQRHVCPECGMASIPLVLRNDFFKATEAAVSRVGLPNHDHPLWTEETGAEWKRRRSADPEIVVDVTPEMTAEEILNALDDAIVASGRPRPGSGPKLV